MKPAKALLLVLSALVALFVLWAYFSRAFWSWAIRRKWPTHPAGSDASTFALPDLRRIYSTGK